MGGARYVGGSDGGGVDGRGGGGWGGGEWGGGGGSGRWGDWWGKAEVWWRPHGGGKIQRKSFYMDKLFKYSCI